MALAASGSAAWSRGPWAPMGGGAGVGQGRKAVEPGPSEGVAWPKSGGAVVACRAPGATNGRRPPETEGAEAWGDELAAASREVRQGREGLRGQG